MIEENRASGFLGFLAGATIGGAVGAGVALLFAPRTGDETRKILKKKVDNLGNEFNNLKKEIIPKVKKAREQLSKKLAATTK